MTDCTNHTIKPGYNFVVNALLRNEHCKDHLGPLVLDSQEWHRLGIFSLVDKAVIHRNAIYGIIPERGLIQVLPVESLGTNANRTP